ncbi:MAG: tRNA (adenosine(37)-N6)-threonylcarbamoyltransferase complex transferase subunit TsaD [Bacteroidia bacterium]
MSNPFTLLAIETSCDDTSVALWQENALVEELRFHQAIHAAYGGVIPEWASREHEIRLPWLYHNLHKKYPDVQLHAVAATLGPGLIGSLLIGVTFAKTLALDLDIPFLGVHHLHAHIASLELPHADMTYPFLCLVATGGHTVLYEVHSPLHRIFLGGTRDDAVGEAFDKIAAQLGLPYPGGPEIEKLSQKGDPTCFSFPYPKKEAPWDYSFSGLKTAFLYARRDHPHLPIEDLAAAWHDHVIHYLLQGLFATAEYKNIPRIAVVGGVSANQKLRSLLHQTAQEKGFTYYLAPLPYCTDNAAMVAVEAYHHWLNAQYTPIDAEPFPTGEKL